MPGRIRTLTVSITVFALFAFAAPFLNPAVAGGNIKCWTNKHGVRECGNVVPPEYAQQGHEKIGRHGLPVEERERALTEEEILEQQREAEELARQEQERAEQARQDRILIQVYSSEQDIINSRDEKIRALESTITLTETRIEKLREDLDKRIEQAAAHERRSDSTDEELLKDIESLERQIRSNEQFIEETRQEQKNICKTHAAEAARFRELQAKRR